LHFLGGREGVEEEKGEEDEKGKGREEKGWRTGFNKFIAYGFMTPPPLPPRPKTAETAEQQEKGSFKLSEGLMIVSMMVVGMAFAMLVGSYFIVEFHSRT